jgi:hypothetical protein
MIENGSVKGHVDPGWYSFFDIYHLFYSFIIESMSRPFCRPHISTYRRYPRL